MKYLILLLIVSSLFSCRKKVSNTDQNNSIITINLTSPAENSIFEPNDQVLIVGKISSHQFIHYYTIELLNASNNNSTLFSDNVHSHDTIINFNYSWPNNVTFDSDIVVKITAYADHQGNISKEVNRSIQCNGL